MKDKGCGHFVTLSMHNLINQDFLQAKLQMHHSPLVSVIVMPAQSKKSQVAKRKRAPGHATFTRPENTPIQETSDYHPSDNNSDTSTTNTDSRNNRDGDNWGMEGVQHHKPLLPTRSTNPIRELAF